MKFISLRSGLRTAALVLALAHSAGADAADTVSARELQGKLTYCKTCHGSSGQGFRAAYAIPRLAGQQTEYFENQLKAFIERRRQNPIMFNVAHVLSPAMLTALSSHFKSLDARPAGGGAKSLVEAGKKLFADGTKDIPACASCHGPQAKGDGMFPRLAGQLPDYTVRKLTSWTAERGLDPKNPDSSAIMEPIAHGLSRAQVDAVAAYLSYLD